MSFGPQHALLGIGVVYGVVQDPSQFWTNEMVRTAVVLAVWDLFGVAARSWRGQTQGNELAVPPRLGPHHILLVLVVAYGLVQKPSDFWTNELVRVCAGSLSGKWREPASRICHGAAASPSWREQSLRISGHVAARPRKEPT
jgi:hypothetical protein